MIDRENLNIVIMGAGAVGGYFGGSIANKTHHNVIFIARGAHLEAMLINGLRVKSINGNFRLRVTASDDPTTIDTADLILMAVKSYDTDQAIRQIKPIVGEQTQILTIQNGIENYPKLVDAFGEHRVVQGYCMIGAEVSEPGVIKHQAMGEVTIGNTSPDQDLQRLEIIRQVFKDAGVNCNISEQIVHDVWFKFAWNCIFNMLTVLTMTTIDELFNNRETIDLCHNIFNEIRAVAHENNVRLTDYDLENIMETSKGFEDGFITSTYQDRKKEKKLEYEAFTGAVVRFAHERGLDVPVNETIYALLKTIDHSIQNQ